MTKFSDIPLDKIRLISFEDNTIHVLLVDDETLHFPFGSREEIAQALAEWATKRPNPK